MTRLPPTGLSLSFLHAQGWVASLLLHAAAVGTAVLALSDLTFVPDKEPFHLDISFVQTSAVPGSEMATAPMAPPQEPAASVAPPMEPPPPVVQPVRQEVRPVAEPIRPVEQPAVVQSPEPVARETKEIAAPKPVDAPEPAVARAKPVESPPASPESVPAAAPSASEVAMAAPQPASTEGPRADYGWLAKSLWQRVMELKRYPHRARLNHWEGKVVLRAVIRHDGHLEDLALHESSGYEELDEAAMELVREACPLHMAQPLGRDQVVVQVPITYALR